ncbi:MAG: hypothetical protein BWX54_01968 [Verrucomicrobia bacterium ADurb.Bin018]|nr:MAG: hypothetical protein BWX54_01968 [Verrucomicrobia bacterium ADurb.Bin018]
MGAEVTRLLLPLIVAATVYTMTWYSLPGQTMRSGQPFSDDALTCAVDDSEWDRDTDRAKVSQRRICSGGKCVDVTITDTGWLHDYGVDLDCTKAVWQTLGIPLSVGRAKVSIYE